VPNQLVLAEVLTDCNVKLTDAEGNPVAVPLRAAQEMCYLELIDDQMGAVGEGGRTGQVWVQGYFVSTSAPQEDVFTKWMLKFTQPKLTVSLDGKLDAGAVMVWAHKAKTTLYFAGIADMPALLPRDEIFKGTRKRGRHFFNRGKGKTELPEAFLAMALKVGIPKGKSIHSGIRNDWTAKDVYNYARMIAAA
jgi:hypothetical protein